MIKNYIDNKNYKQKVNLGKIKQITFTIKEVTKLAFKIRPGLLILVFILNALSGFLAVPSFYLEKLIIDKLIKAAGTTNWKPIFYSILLIVGLSILLSLFRNFLSSFNGFLRRNLSRYFDAEIDELLGTKMSQLPLPTMENPDFMDKFTKIERESGRRAWGLMMPLSDIPNYLSGFISSTAVLVLVHPLVSLGIFIVSIPSFLVDSRFIKKEYELNTLLSEKHRIWAWIRHYLIMNRNFMELKILNISDYLTKKMRKIMNEILKKRELLSKKREISSLAGFLPLTLYEFGISAFLIFSVIVGKITVGSFQLYLRSLRSAEQNLSGLVSSFLEIYENYIYVTDLIWLLNLEPEIVEEKGAEKYCQIAKSSIEFKDVWFKYNKNLDWVLKGINLSIKPGEKIAIVGENGAGKSTLIKLLAGFYIQQLGEINIGNCDLRNVNLIEWRNKLAVLFQEFELYPFSVKDAIGYGDVENIDNLGKIKEVAKKTGVDEFIEGLDLKYDNPLAPEFEKGVRPSVGQWQRLGISRMLFREKADVLILDEPTSNVDPLAEEKIFKELVEITRNKILIFVTQRFSSVKIADRIMVLHKGEIVEQGTHNELINKNGRYAKLFSLQAQIYLDTNI